MTEGPDIARTAALIGDPARAGMLAALMRGQALTVSELAAEAGIGLPTASAHLARLEGGGLIAPRRQGRHKYFALASEEVAALLEALMRFSGGTAPTRLPGPRDPALRQARICYNHLAGDRGVQLYDSLVARGFLRMAGEGLRLSEEGAGFVAGFGIDLAALHSARPPICRECLDWSARRSHLGGRLGRAFLLAIEARGWARRSPGSRVIAFSAEGARQFGLAFPAAQADESLDARRLCP